MNEALELQRIRPKRVAEILMDLGYVEEDHVLEALSEQFDIPFERNIADDIDPALTTKVPISFIREYHMVPYRRNGEAFIVAVNNPVNLLPLDDLRLLLGGPVTARALPDGRYPADHGQLLRSTRRERGRDDR